MASSTSASLPTLDAVLDQTLSLLTQLETVVQIATSKASPPPAAASPDKRLDALALAADAAALVKAHATKISLFIINEPFTPSAIASVLRDANAGPLPGLASAPQACDAARHTGVLRAELAFRVGRVLKGFRELVEKIPRDGKVLKNGGGAGKDKDKDNSIAGTAVLWSACDDVVELSKMGVAGYLVRKVEQFRDTLKDVMEELKEWAEEGDQALEDDEGDDDDADGDDADEADSVADSLAATHIDTQAMLDDLMNSQQYIPRDDPYKIRERLDSCLRRLRLTTLLYQAVVKRRLKTAGPYLAAGASNEAKANAKVASRLDEVIPILRRIPERFGSLAMAFYELDPEEIDKHMDQVFFDAFAVSELLVRPWEGQKDEFTDWAAKFQVEIKKV